MHKTTSVLTLPPLFTLPSGSDLDLPELACEHVDAVRASWYLAWKPWIDAALALGLLIFLTPIVLLAAILIRLTSKGPAFYRQTRVGKDGIKFTIFKLRTMVVDSEAATGAVWSQAGDPRVTTLGRFLRATHIDEFPQLINVLQGHMSLLGPRPERPEIVDYLAEKVPHYLDRLQMAPGISGLAQVQLPPDVDLYGVHRKLVCDLHYIRHFSFELDLRLTLCTALMAVGIPQRWSRRLFGVPTLFDDAL